MLRLWTYMGATAKGDEDLLHMDLVEKYRGLPVNMQVISCTMEELCRNVRAITPELFGYGPY